VVVDEAHRLHERVTDGRPHEAEATSPQVRAQRARHVGLGGQPIDGAAAALQRPSLDEAPHVVRERAVLALHGQERPRVDDGALDLAPMPHDALVAEQPAHVARTEARHAPRVEARECAPVVRTLAEDRRPRQTRLGPFQHEEFEEPLVVAHRHAPLAVVILDVQRLARPRAAARQVRGRL